MTEQERFEKFIAGLALFPSNLAKVKDEPILGWNGAQPTDYVNNSVQLHWETWQAATQSKSEPVQQWISVDERLPEIDGQYLCIVELDGDCFNREQDVMHYMENHGWRCFDDDGVTHWMPLPALPQVQL